MIETIISDLGRVLIDFDNSIFIRKMTRFCAFSEEEIRSMIFREFTLIEAFDRGELTPEEFYDRAVRKLKASLGYDEFFSIYNDVFSLNPPVVDSMKKLKDRFKLILCSNTDSMRFGFIKKTFPEILFFDEYVLSYEVGSMKPDPLIYRVALGKAGSQPEACVFIDDREENIDAASKLGIKGILFAPGTDLEGALKKILSI